MKTFFEYLFESEQNTRPAIHLCKELYEMLRDDDTLENKLSLNGRVVRDEFIKWCENETEWNNREDKPDAEYDGDKYRISNLDAGADKDRERLEELFKLANKYLSIKTTSVGVISGINIEKTNKKLDDMDVGIEDIRNDFSKI